MQNAMQKSKHTKTQPDRIRVQMAVEKGIHRHLKKLAFVNEYDSLKSFHTAVINAGLRALKLPEYNIKNEKAVS